MQRWELSSFEENGNLNFWLIFLFGVFVLVEGVCVEYTRSIGIGTSEIVDAVYDCRK